jgi:thioredoxin-dependent peroxiredoxin
MSVRDAGSRLRELNVAYVGVSGDAPSVQKKFDDKNDLTFPLLSDKDRAVADAYGVWQEKNMYGKKIWGIARSSFLIDEEGRIEAVWYKVSPQDTVPKALEALESGTRKG